MGRKKIVIIEDDSILSKTLDICLSKKGHEVKVFYNGVDAVKYLFEEKPDSVVLDIRLPDCDGWFIAKLLEKLEGMENVPVIVISVMEHNRTQLSEVKPYAYIQKPFDMGQLLEAVEGSLNQESPLTAA